MGALYSCLSRSLSLSVSLSISVSLSVSLFFSLSLSRSRFFFLLSLSNSLLPSLGPSFSSYTLSWVYTYSSCVSTYASLSLSFSREHQKPFLIKLSHGHAHAHAHAHFRCVSTLSLIRAHDRFFFAIGAGWRRSWAGRRNAPGASRPRTSFPRRTRTAASPWRTASRRSAWCARRENRAPSTTR